MRQEHKRPPPTLALLAMSTSLRLKPKSLPSPSKMVRCSAICKRQKKKMLGAVVMTALTDEFALRADEVHEAFTHHRDFRSVH